MTSLAQMKARLNQIKNANNNEAPTQEKTFRPDDPQEVNMNKINTGEEVSIRFVEDGDKSNDFFWRAYCYHELTFRGVKGDASKENVITTVRVPAYNVTLDKFGNTSTFGDSVLNVPQASQYTNFQDPIQKYVKDNKLYEQTDRTVIDATGKEITLYNALKRKVQYLAQGYIVKAPESLKVYEDARPLKHFRLMDSIIKNIERYILDEENANDEPLSLTDGVNFNYRKTQQGQFNNYDTSSFGRLHSSVSQECLEDYEKYGPDFIGDRIPKTPNDAERAVIAEMLDAFLGNLPYNPEWDALHFQKFVRQPKTGENTEPTWNSPANTYQETYVEAPQHAAQQQVQAVMNDIVGAPTQRPIEQRVNDSIPFQEPVTQVQTSSMPKTQEETLAILNSLQ